MAELSAAAVIGGTSRATQDLIWGGGVQLRYGQGLGTSNWSAFANATATTGFNTVADRLAWDLTGGINRHFARFDVAARAGYAGARLRLADLPSPNYAHGLATGAEVYTGVFNTHFDVGIAVDGFFALQGNPSASPQLGYQVMLRWAPERELSQPTEVTVVSDQARASETMAWLRELPTRVCGPYMIFTTYDRLHTEVLDLLRYARGSAEIDVLNFKGGKYTLMSLDMLFDDVLKDPRTLLNKNIAVPTREAVRKLLLDGILDDLRGSDILSRNSTGFPCLSLVYYLLFEGNRTRASVTEQAKYPESPAFVDQVALTIASYENFISKTEVLVKAVEDEFGSLIDAGAQNKLNDVKSILSCLRTGGEACEPRLASVSLRAIREQSIPSPRDLTAKE